MGITLSSTSNGTSILVCDAVDKAIKEYNTQGQFLRHLATYISSLFEWPMYISLYQEGSIVVTDYCLRTVFIFELATGNLISRFKQENFFPSKACELQDGSILIGESANAFANKTCENILSETRKNLIESTIPFPCAPISLATTQDHLYVGCKDGNIYIMPHTDHGYLRPLQESQVWYV